MYNIYKIKLQALISISIPFNPRSNKYFLNKWQWMNKFKKINWPKPFYKINYRNEILEPKQGWLFPTACELGAQRLAYL